MTQLRSELAPPRRVVHELPSEAEIHAALSTFRMGELGNAVATGPDYRPGDLVHGPSDGCRSEVGPAFFISPGKTIVAARELKRSHPDWVARTLEHADRAADGRISVYAREARIVSARDWADVPAGPVRDSLYHYRPQRFAFAPRLALAHLLGHQSALSTLKNLLQGWMVSIQKDALLGREYETFSVSSHVSVYRAIASSWSLAFLVAAEERDVDLEILCLRILLGDARHIAHCMPHTTPNNHLLADGFGLWYLGSLFPEFGDAEIWARDGMCIFRQELLRQIYPDGTSFEQSVHYQEHICEMGVAYLLLCKRNNWVIDDELQSRIRAMLEFQSALTGVDGSCFGIGDTTEDPLFPLDGDEAHCSPALRAVFGYLFNKPSRLSSTLPPSLERIYWLTGGVLPKDTSRPVPSEACIREFRDGGFAIFNARSESQRLIFRTGPPPESTLVPGHMHFDYLSVYLVVDGNPVIVPSGTYTYRSTTDGWRWKYGDWRSYFLSARSSNGLALSEEDPLQRPRGDFPGGITGKIACHVETGRGRFGRSISLITARIVGDGEYMGWARSVILINDEYWIVLDKLPEESPIPGRLAFQFPSHATLEILEPRTALVRVGDTRVVMSMNSGPGESRCLVGSMRPLGGWVSERYGQLTAAPQLIIPIEGVRYAACVISRIDDAGLCPRTVEITTTIDGLELQIFFGETCDQLLLGSNFFAGEDGVHWRRTRNAAVMEEAVI